MLPKHYLSISKFGKLTQIPRKTLIYYDSIGLLKPEIYGDNGYRYYTLKQVEISYIIIVLRSLDMPLDEIKSYLNNRSPELGLHLFMGQLSKIDKKIAHMLELRKYIEHQIKITQEGFQVVFDKPILENHDAELYFVSEFNVTFETALSSPLVSEFFDTLFEIEALPNYNIGLLYSQSNVDMTSRQFNLTLRATQFEKRMRQIIKEAGHYLCIYHAGVPENFDLYIDVLQDYARKHDLILGQHYFYDYVWDEIVVESRSAQICKVSIQILER